MTVYVRVWNGVTTYPYSAARLIGDEPETCFAATMPDERLADWGVFPVTETAAPEVDHRQSVREAMPVPADGGWRQAWEIVDEDAEEIAARTARRWADVREERNRRLTASDKYVLPWIEKGLAVPDAVLAYRQALRDIPDQPCPFAVAWPDPPGA